uniref:Uncharacterized protein n=2 Tax=Avena sativa TaxID=4498 RepID=A0ACD5U276_AVESA
MITKEDANLIGLDTDLSRKLQEPSLQVAGDDFQHFDPEMMGGGNGEDILLQDGFSYTGLLEGTFDTLYTPNAEKKKLGHNPGGDSCMAPFSEDFRHTCSGASQSFNVEHQNDMSLDYICDDDPWDRSLFENMELDEVSVPQDSFDRDLVGEQSQLASAHSVYTRSRATKEIDQSDIQAEEEEKELCEEDIDNFLENENSATEEQNDNTVEDSLKPEIGMQFKTREEAQNFFNMYAFAAGFSVAIVGAYRTTSKKRHNEITRVTVKCNKFGNNTEIEKEQLLAQRQSTVIAKTDCKVEMVISENNGIWKIKNLCLEHNHILDPQSRFFRSHAYMTKEEKSMIRSLKHSNIPTRQIVSVLAHLRGGSDQLPYNKKKVSNYGTSINRELTHSDMMEVLSFFSKKRAENPEFYSSFQLDSNNKVQSVFWADDKYIMDRWRKKDKKLLPNLLPEKVADNDMLRYNVLSRKLVHTASKGSKSKRKYEYLLKEIDRIEGEMAKMDVEIEELMQEQTTSTRTIANIATTSNEDGTISTIQLLDPDIAHTKGRPRMLTIREAIKANKFYKCSHCGSTQHTLRNCPNKDLVYNLPKPKKPRRSKKVVSGTQDPNNTFVVPKKKIVGRRKKASTETTMEQSMLFSETNSKESTMSTCDPTEMSFAPKRNVTDQK